MRSRGLQLGRKFNTGLAVGTKLLAKGRMVKSEGSQRMNPEPTIVTIDKVNSGHG